MLSNKKLVRSLKGFTLIELMITVTIVAILAAIAVPTYLNYTRRAYFAEVVEASAPYKVGVSECFQHMGTLVSCDGGSNHVPANITTTTGNIASVAVSGGAITVTPVAAHGIESTDTYVLTPTAVGNTLTWVASGAGVTKGYAQ